MVKKFGLSLSQDKTRIIKFSRFEKDASYFEFLGFEFHWGVDRKGRDMIKRRTSRKKLRTSLKNFTLLCLGSRNFRLKKIFKLLNAKLRGITIIMGLLVISLVYRSFSSLRWESCTSGWIVVVKGVVFATLNLT